MPPRRVSNLYSFGTYVFEPGADFDDPSAYDKYVRTGVWLPDIAVDPRGGHLYLVWQDFRFIDRFADTIAFSMSTDGGATWSEPVPVVPGGEQAFTPSVEVASDGTVAVTYYYLPNDDQVTDHWLVQCSPTRSRPCSDRAAWGGEVRLTDISFDITRAPYAYGFFVGDYAGLASDGLDFLTLFSQSQGNDPASAFFRRVGP